MGELQRELGISTERRVSNVLRGNGYWALFIPSAQGGQPFDIVASRYDRSIMIEVKNVNAGKRFPFSRIEANQWASLKYAKEYAHCNNIGFAIYWKGSDWLSFLPYSAILDLQAKGEKSVTEDSCVDFVTWLGEV